jgi:hypothetical protein
LQVFDECGENSPHQSKWDDNAIDTITTDIVISGIPDAKKIKNNRKHKMPGSSSSCSSPKKKKTEVTIKKMVGHTFKNPSNLDSRF